MASFSSTSVTRSNRVTSTNSIRHQGLVLMRSHKSTCRIVGLKFHIKRTLRGAVTSQSGTITASLQASVPATMTQNTTAPKVASTIASKLKTCRSLTARANRLRPSRSSWCKEVALKESSRTWKTSFLTGLSQWITRSKTMDLQPTWNCILKERPWTANSSKRRKSTSCQITIWIYF